ncbi:WG repeat-containing protein [Paraflavitalea sp. CAU 1676]|uniref:WG repeat-containing protein n=1 Tax=Paraflavitalea sp. CAU 1676 TaxID=3032598 RepID=UPI0023DB1C45|nr:WG repeat-containing protein [Paraflavitalea sp. CAU 1676]MDF2188090.1 WG repeat-containing protein [Paraflavitalea sp. CAU 1676]
MKDPHQDLFPVTKDGKSGFIDCKGKVVIDFEFDAVTSFSDEFDKTGNYVWEPTR